MLNFLQYFQLSILVFFILQHLLQGYLLACEGDLAEVDNTECALAGDALDFILAVIVQLIVFSFAIRHLLLVVGVWLSFKKFRV